MTDISDRDLIRRCRAAGVNVDAFEATCRRVSLAKWAFALAVLSICMTAWHVVGGRS